MTTNEHSKPSIGFIGMGHMGSHMARKLLDAGYHLTVYDRTQERARGPDVQGPGRELRHGDGLRDQ